MIRALLFRALNRADAEFPRYERALETAGTVAAIGLYATVVTASLALSVVVAPTLIGIAKALDGLVAPEACRCGADCAVGRVDCDGRPS